MSSPTLVALGSLKAGDHYLWAGLLFEVVSDESVEMYYGGEGRRVRYVMSGDAGLASVNDCVEPASRASGPRKIIEDALQSAYLAGRAGDPHWGWRKRSEELLVAIAETGIVTVCDPQAENSAELQDHGATSLVFIESEYAREMSCSVECLGDGERKALAYAVGRMRVGGWGERALEMERRLRSLADKAVHGSAPDAYRRGMATLEWLAGIDRGSPPMPDTAVGPEAIDDVGAPTPEPRWSGKTPAGEHPGDIAVGFDETMAQAREDARTRHYANTPPRGSAWPAWDAAWSACEAATRRWMASARVPQGETDEQNSLRDHANKLEHLFEDVAKAVYRVKPGMQLTRTTYQQTIDRVRDLADEVDGEEPPRLLQSIRSLGRAMNVPAGTKSEDVAAIAIERLSSASNDSVLQTDDQSDPTAAMTDADAFAWLRLQLRDRKRFDQFYIEHVALRDGTDFVEVRLFSITCAMVEATGETLTQAVARIRATVEAESPGHGAPLESETA